MESTALETKILSLTEESSTGVSSLMAAFPPQEFYNLSDISSEQNVHSMFIDFPHLFTYNLKQVKVYCKRL